MSKTLGQLAYEQSETEEDKMHDVVLNSGWLTDLIGISHGKIDINVNKKNILNVTNNGIQTQNNVHNTGSIQRERRSYFEADNLSKEFFIPSSTVTPIPSQLPWTGVLNIIGKLAGFVTGIQNIFKFRW